MIDDKVSGEVQGGPVNPRSTRGRAVQEASAPAAATRPANQSDAPAYQRFDKIEPTMRDKELLKKSERVPLWLNVPVGLAHMAWAMYDGFIKYGIASWRKPEVEVTSLSMIGAAERHLQLLKDGEDYATDTPNGAHHAGHVMASMQIYLDCWEANKPGFDNRVKGPAPGKWPCKKK
jgi:hypothetical protein